MSAPGDRFVPLADARALRPWARVTGVVAGALAVAAVLCGAWFAFVARDSGTRTFMGLPPHTNGVIVLDMSASIGSSTYALIGGTLQTLSRSGGRYGLVVFSASAYEALPPGTPASDLAPLVRYFKLPAKGGQFAGFPSNPWTTFTSGTKISAGMQLATRLAAAQRRPATIILVSDLNDDPGDLRALTQVLFSDRAKHIPVHIVGLNPTQADVDYVENALGPRTQVTSPPTLREAPSHITTPFPWGLVALAVAISVLLGVGLAWAPRLDWRVS